jgi:hypothetical protein
MGRWHEAESPLFLWTNSGAFLEGAGTVPAGTLVFPIEFYRGYLRLLIGEKFFLLLESSSRSLIPVEEDR